VPTRTARQGNHASRARREHLDLNRLLTAAADGWTALRWAVLHREGGCIAVQPDKIGFEEAATDLCRNGQGWEQKWDDVLPLELDHIKEHPGGARVHDEAHLVAVCAWHHRGGKGGAQWATAHRAAIRAYLTRLYPHIWGTDGTDTPDST
jgi:hypothetical protein